MDDLTPKERELKAYLEHLVVAHGQTDLDGYPGCLQCDTFKAVLA